MWKIRHEGSPQHLEVTLEQIRQGLVDGAWEPTDEVMGPGESDWTAIEAHPQLEELAAEIEPPPPHAHDDQTHLDMTALIDVCLVLLVFFILTTTVAALQVRLEAPSIEPGQPKVKAVKRKDVEESMILCRLRFEGGETVIRVEEDTVEPAQLAAAFLRYKTRKKTSLLLDHDENVPHEAVVQVIDAAKAAGMDRIQMLVP